MSEFISKHIWKFMLLILLISALSIYAAADAYFQHFPGEISSDHEKWGTFGDYFGGILNPTLSFLALIALLLTIVLQSSELKITREELELSRIAQEKSEISLREQAETLEKQLEQAKRASNAEYFFRAIDRMQNEEVRSARRRVFELHFDKQIPFSKWHSQDIKVAEKVCQTYDLVGMMIKNSFVEEQMILSSWHTSIGKSWASTKDLVNHRRKIEGDEFWCDFEWLYNASKKYSNQGA